jgi:hypothetical protein
MARTAQTQAKRARELALKEKRERKQAKKAARAAGEPWPANGNDDGAPETEDHVETEAVPEESETQDAPEASA